MQVNWTHNPEKLSTTNGIYNTSGFTYAGYFNEGGEYNEAQFAALNPILTDDIVTTWNNLSVGASATILTLTNGNYIQLYKSDSMTAVFNFKNSQDAEIYSYSISAGIMDMLNHFYIMFMQEASTGYYIIYYTGGYIDGQQYYRTYGGEEPQSAEINQKLVTFFNGAIPSSDIIGTGGGATHIAKVTGLLSTLSSNLSDVLIVAGGGGGGLIRDESAFNGSDAGGISGNGDNSADQSTGYAFGQGESPGGGGGLYGGNKA